jgi:glycosyltransferase involved in cell wall biosynthesis
MPARGPFKIAMVAASPFPYPQGSQVLIGQLAGTLQRRGHAVKMVAYHCGVGPPPAGVEIHRIRALPGLGLVRARPSWRKPLLDLFLARALLRLVHGWPADVLHAHNFEGLLVALFVRRLTGVPVVYHIHNAMGLELHTYFDSRPGRWAGGVVGRWVDAHLPRRADHCIVLNEQAVGYFRQRGAERLTLIPPGIDFEPGDAARARQHLGDGPLVLYSGNLDRYQDLDLLLAAFEQVARARPDARLVFSTNACAGETQVCHSEERQRRRISACAGDSEILRSLRSLRMTEASTQVCHSEERQRRRISACAGDSEILRSLRSLRMTEASTQVCHSEGRQRRRISACVGDSEILRSLRSLRMTEASTQVCHSEERQRRRISACAGDSEILRSLRSLRMTGAIALGLGRLLARVDELGLGRQVVFIQANDFDLTRDLLAAADVAVCPRLTCLGFPIKLLNYMAAGKAIVASAGSACGLRHLENGWLVEGGDVAGIATAILTLLDDPVLARHLGEIARQTALREYTWDRAVDAIEEIYESVGQVDNLSNIRRER